MKNQRLVLSLLLAFLSTPILAEDTSSYRVAGIITLTNGDHLAVIEWPSGEQQILHRGDGLGDGKILEITSEYIQLEFPNGKNQLWLRAGNSNVEASARPTKGPVILSVPVSVELLQNLKQLATEPKAGDKSDASAKLNVLLKLSPDARISAINESPATGSAVQTAKILLEQLDKGRIPHLFISGTEQVNEVYLTPVREQNGVQ